jgi:FKBP-type peptidyl-prolyl cis-trans isomerase
MNQNQPIINTEGLEVSDIMVGTGAEAKNGDLLAVNYTGWLEDGEQFDSSSGKGQFQFVIGAGQVIPGWEIGVLGMKEGGKRRIVIPPALAYGENGVDPVIPPNATITFEVELVKVSKAPQQ